MIELDIEMIDIDTEPSNILKPLVSGTVNFRGHSPKSNQTTRDETQKRQD